MYESSASLLTQLESISDLRFDGQCVKTLFENLAPGEVVEAAFTCRVKTIDGERSTFLFGTDTRLMMISPGLFGAKLQYREWSRPGLRATYQKGRVSLSEPSGFGWVEMKNLKPDTAAQIYKYLQSKGLVEGAVKVHVTVESGDVAEQLRQLQQLVAEGVLTSADMERAKDRYLGHPPDKRESMLRTLRSLHELRSSGVLTQIEFDAKKRQILASTG